MTQSQGGQAVDIDGTISALQGGLTSLSPSVAVSNIQGWEQQLQGSNDPATQQIAADLGELRQLLTSGSLDGKAIGQVLSRLGTGTTSVAAGAGGAQSKLQQLGQLLSKAGETLS